MTSKWSTTPGGGLRLDVTVPANTTATVRLPATSPSLVTESGRPLSQAPCVTNVSDDGSTVSLNIASGTYHFLVSDH